MSLHQLTDVKWHFHAGTSTFSVVIVYDLSMLTIYVLKIHIIKNKDLKHCGTKHTEMVSTFRVVQCCKIKGFFSFTSSPVLQFLVSRLLQACCASHVHISFKREKQLKGNSTNFSHPSLFVDSKEHNCICGKKGVRSLLHVKSDNLTQAYHLQAQY